MMEDEKNARDLLERYAGLEDTEHGANTPKRFLAMLDELTQCRDGEDDTKHEEECIKWKMFPSEGDEMVIVENIPFTSVCNHHVVPFIGRAHIAYVPGQWNAGLSKFARVVRHFAKQLQVQERLTQQVAEYLDGQLEPRGVAVVLKAEHMCMTLRGVQAAGAVTKTSALSGVIKEVPHSRAEFLSIVG